MTITDILREDHRNMARLLDVLERQVQMVAENSEPDYELIQGVVDYFCDYPDTCHHPKEDAVLDHLRVIRPLEAAPIGDLAREHRDAAARVRRFRRNMQALFRDETLPRETIVSGARSFVDGERQHMRFEEASFFPLVERNFGPQDWQAVEKHLETDTGSAFEVQIEQRFRAAGERLLALEQR